jgi:TrmH family RNA methyltransferase
MLSKARIKLIQSLLIKKNRKAQQLFVVEGKKQVAELLQSSFHIQSLVATAPFLDEYAQDIKNGIEITMVSEDELQKASLQQQPQEALAVVHIPQHPFNSSSLNQQFTIMLDGIQDPGNLGTIIRIADWYGIKQVICSLDCVDVYNPKTIQATMGSFLRVMVHYHDLQEILKDNTLPLYAAIMDGQNLHHTTFSQEGILLIGNEGKGITENLLQFKHQPITIPKFGEAESLNAGVATAIICDAWARTFFK